MCFLKENGLKKFLGNPNDYEMAAKAALNCLYFKEDVEEELACDDQISCFNCRYRRWTSTSFVCLKV